ncbi:SusC/RagA family TonB-linked outer membrane protein [Chryseosolibacter indicus]|uniref:TonB-dependent receptor n=1 Tax=Chryseosolibacter indicus TaxID=2782351 RepID=A0ABS5VTK0_9BACT|nr:TonB-dependent receptor [Chryseosolibacter indicus]MBT1704745.1 TonB-dependent receptor [Chryseosolibacter indicus]
MKINLYVYLLWLFLLHGLKGNALQIQDSSSAVVVDTVVGAVQHTQGNTIKTPPREPSSQVKVTGIVTSADNLEPIPGVNVLLKNTSIGSVTDINGAFSIMAPGNAVLIFSFVGMQTKEISINGRTSVNVSLSAESEVLNEVVVVGYGTMDRASLTSAVSTIGSNMIEKDPLPSITQAIQGKAGGVQVTQKSGSPGGGVSIRIRGTSSINAGSDPLYVVDGIPVNSSTNFVGGSDFNFGGGTQGINILSSINPTDIESVEVLKDAASSSIYGARAANGVILITTKRGSRNSNTISLNAYTGFSQMPSERKYKLMNTADYISYMQDYYSYKGTPVPESILRTDVNTDWQNEIFRTAPIQNYELSASGGSDKTQYYSSIGYYNQQGIILNSAFSRLSARLNVDHQFNDKLKFSMNVNLTRAVNDRVQEENSKEGSTKNGIVTPPNVPVYNADGTFAFDAINTARENPVAMLTLPVNTAETFRVLTNAFVEYKITPALSFKTNWGVDMSYIDETFFMPPDYIKSFASSRGIGANRSTKDQLWVNENTLTFDKQLAQHKINVLGGISFQESKYSFVDARRSNFASNDIPIVSAGGTLSGAAATIQEWAILSYFSRVNYGFKNRYLLTANFRVDGSSRFGVDNKYGMFPSVAAAWRISEESFLKPVSKINNLKLRTSWGITGNQNILNYASYSLYSSGNNYLNTAGFVPSALGDRNLGWEKTSQLDIGIDVGLFNDRISLLADYYYKKTSDLLIGIQIPKTSGFQSLVSNVGEIENKGFEFELTTKNIVGEFSWNTSLNMTFNRNKILELPEGDIYGGVGNLNIAREGVPIGSFYGWKMIGVNPETGMIDYARNDGTVGPPSRGEDKRIIGNPNPKFFGGITNTFFYKGFDLSIMGQFTYGNDVFNYNLFTVLSGSSDSNNGLTDWNRRWREPGDVTDVPRPTPSNFDNGTVSSRFVEDGSFFRLRNITLGYTLPTKITNRLNINSLRLYATVQNAYVFTKYRGYDPEVSSSHGGANAGLTYGYDYGSYPQPRMFTSGITLTF